MAKDEHAPRGKQREISGYQEGFADDGDPYTAIDRWMKDVEPGDIKMIVLGFRRELEDAESVLAGLPGDRKAALDKKITLTILEKQLLQNPEIRDAYTKAKSELDARLGENSAIWTYESIQARGNGIPEPLRKATIHATIGYQLSLRFKPVT